MSSVVRDPNPFAFDSRARDEIALFLAKAVLAAGPAVMEEYDRGCEVSSKQDGSPVTLGGSPRRSHHLRTSGEREALSAHMR